MILIVRNPRPAPCLPLSLRRRTGGLCAFAVVRMASDADCLCRVGASRFGCPREVAPSILSDHSHL